MDFQMEFLSGKPKQVFKKRGQAYTRKGYDIRVSTAEKFRRKCSLLGETETRMVERLIESFNQASGWGTEVKSAPMFEENTSYHIRDAVTTVLREVLPWKL